MPFFSIIIASYNAETVIGAALASLAEQRCRDFEVLIQDGASTDGTVAVAERFRNVLPSLVVRSERDAGVYDAWEKIIPQAQGVWIQFLGTDDRLADPHVLERAKVKLQGLSESIRFALGHLTYVKPDGTEIRSLLLCPEGMRALLPYENPIGHAAVFHRRAFFAQHHFDVSFRVLGDYDFFCKYWRDECAAGIRVLVAKVRLGGLSNSEKWMHINKKESSAIRKKYFPIQYYKRKLTFFFFICWAGIKKYLKQFSIIVYIYNKLRAIARVMR